MVINCPNCGRENPDTVRLCSYCDHELQASEAINCPVCGRTNAPETDVCPHCGTNLQEAIHSHEGGPPVGAPTPVSSPAETDADDIRDLFSDLTDGASEETSLESTPSEAVPDWLLEAAEPATPGEPAEPARPEAKTVSDDWLDQALGAGEGEEEAAPTSTPPFPVSAEDDADTPDWLTEAATTPSEPTSPEAQAVSDDWLDQALGAGEGEEETASTPPFPAPAEDDADAPDWLTEATTTPSEPTPPEPETVSDDWLDQALGADEEQAAPAPPPPAPAEDDVDAPDWLTEATTTPSEPTQPEAETVTDDAGVPDWLAEVGIASESPLDPDADADAPDWLSQAVGAEPAPALPTPETTTPEEPIFADPRPPVGDDDMPDWLADVTREKTGPLPPLEEEPEPVAAPEAEVEAPAPDQGEGDMPDWLAAMQPASPEVAEITTDPSPVPFEGSLADLLAEDQASLEDAIPAERAEEESVTEPMDLETGELPDWLQAARPAEDGTVVAEVTSGEAPTEPEEILEQMEMLRAASIPGVLDPDADVREENVGPLKGVMGVVAPAPIFAELQQPAEATAEATVEVDSAQVSLLQDLLSVETEGVPVTGALGGVLEAVGRGLVTLLLLAAIGLPVVAGITPFDAPDTIDIPAADAARSLSALDASSTVLLAFEYDPSHAGEVGVEAEALITTLMARGVTLYAVSTQPTGPSIAQNLLEGLAEEQGYIYGEDYVNLGYVSAKSTGVRGLVAGSAAGMVSPLAYDYKGANTGFADARLTDLDVDMIVLFAGTSESVRMWVEQAGTPTGIPIVAAVGAGTEPMTLPYYNQGRQLEGVVSGLAGATSLTLATHGMDLSPTLNTRMNAQVAGALAAGLALVVGVVVQVFASRFRRR